ncbi:TetR/AcrR family transcriptional regulator [Brevundimonas sp.]|jgi:AcrR family transcriptional regulator|uniref:TetR/AcrR family transcriptional regulator n=1 Tax=Brevundimonas sp. TaxID=1871086 RepID=UPI0019C66639|nr:TetR/AcrR family transcriptional regulator [Brevundimonas sp.]MBD3836114.1 TetR/AcrR family transcriptional regulator [Brevundimonas sp.]MDO9609751.1 TetR/AcrR family transcriptional regulator [Brevundimonas sp.]
MPPPREPKWRRRAAHRPKEIIAAALEVFSERGFARARLDDIAKAAGVSKGALYLYFETKQDLFKAVVQDAVEPGLLKIRADATAEIAFDDAARLGFGVLVSAIRSNPRIGGVVKLIIAESRNLPELALIWHETVITPLLSLMADIIRRGQRAGEVRSGDPELFAMGLLGPLVLGLLWRETFEPVGAKPLRLDVLAAQHLDVALKGMKA